MYILPRQPTVTRPSSRRLRPSHTDQSSHPSILHGELMSRPDRQATVTLSGLVSNRNFDAALYPRRSWLTRVKHNVVRVLAFLERERHIARAVAELSRLDDRMLQDLGIERGNIANTVRHGRDID